MEAQQNTTDQAKLIALQGKAKDLPLEDVLRQVYSHLLSENEHKREQIEELATKLKNLEKTLISERHEKNLLHGLIKEEHKKHEGSKQLINKLLEDIRRYQNDIDWYKRTYETRSLMGTIKEKLLGMKK